MNEIKDLNIEPVMSTGSKYIVNVLTKVHLIIYTDSINKSDLNTFKASAETLEKDYKTHYQNKRHQIQVKMVYSGKEIVDLINNLEDKSLFSLDIISHGNQGGIQIARKLSSPIEAGFFKKRMHVLMRSNSRIPQTEKDAEFIEESMHGLYSDIFARTLVSYFYNQTYEENNDTSIISDINFTKFAEGAFVEFHGCKTAEYIDWLNDIKDNFAEKFSRSLPPNSITIGHISYSSPNRNPNGNKNDYRYGKVNVYIKGELKNESIERWGLKFVNSSTPP